MPSSLRPQISSVRPMRRLTRSAVVLSALSLIGLLSCDGSPTAPTVAGSLHTGRIENWPTASPASRGVSAAVLEELGQRIDAEEFGEISSLLIARSGDLIYERYWDAWQPDDLHRVYSVSKSVTSLLVGIAQDDGTVPDLDTAVLDLLPGVSPSSHPAGKASITLRHVLTMRTGLKWDELSTNYSEGANPTIALATSSDWLDFVMSLPFADEAGTRFAYNSGVSMLMAGVLASAAGMSAEDFAAEHLFDELGITDWFWSEGPQGLTNSGWGLRLRPRDMATIGQMVLQSGTWDGTEVVPASWIEESGRAATRFVEGTGYGYQWWLPRDDGGRPPMAAWGYGGQFIVVIPSLELVVVSTAENFAGGGFTPYSLADWLYRAVAAAAPSSAR